MQLLSGEAVVQPLLNWISEYRNPDTCLLLLLVSVTVTDIYHTEHRHTDMLRGMFKALRFLMRTSALECRMHRYLRFLPLCHISHTPYVLRRNISRYHVAAPHDALHRSIVHAASVTVRAMSNETPLSSFIFKLGRGRFHMNKRPGSNGPKSAYIRLLVVKFEVWRLPVKCRMRRLLGQGQVSGFDEWFPPQGAREARFLQ